MVLHNVRGVAVGSIEMKWPDNKHIHWVKMLYLKKEFNSMPTNRWPTKIWHKDRETNTNAWVSITKVEYYNIRITQRLYKPVVSTSRTGAKLILTIITIVKSPPSKASPKPATNPINKISISRVLCNLSFQLL